MDQANLIEKLKGLDNIYLIPTYLSDKSKERLESFWKKSGFKNHVFICSSGTGSGRKIKSYALSKKSLLNNARAVNDFLGASSSDSWLCSLPFFHVGGLSIYFRALLSNSQVHSLEGRWSAEFFVQTLKEKKVSYTSLVPTQLYDILQEELSPSKELKGVFVGGDFLAPSLARHAISLGWPIIATYGATELCSQIASSFILSGEDDIFLEVLPIHNLIKDEEKSEICSSSFYTAEMILDEENEKEEIRVFSEEKMELPDYFEMKEEGNKQFLKPLGRKSDEFKINGRLVNFLDLKGRFFDILIARGFYGRGDIVLRDDERSGKKINLLLENSLKSYSEELKDEVNNSFGSRYKISEIEFLEVLGKTSLGKIKSY